MTESGTPRTRLEQILSQRHLTVDQFRAHYERAAGEVLSARQAYRWVAGALKNMPYPRAQAVLERMFGEPATRLLGPPYGHPPPPGARIIDARHHEQHRWQEQLIAVGAERARAFLIKAEAVNVGSESLDQLTDDVRRLTRAYPLEPLEVLLSDIVETQAQAFTLLEGRQRPEHTRDLYLLAGVVSGLMAKASHDLGSSHDALTQARTAHVCADQAGHDGLRAWTRGLQSMICYWAGRLDEAVRYAEQGSTIASRGRGTSSVWLLANRARASAALGRMADARTSIAEASESREHVQPDEMDDLGGLCTFARPRQLYYAADALRWGGVEDAASTEQQALEALDAYQNASEDEYAFSDEAGARCALAVARIELAEIDGAFEALAPVLQLPPARRIHGIVSSVNFVKQSLGTLDHDTHLVAELSDATQEFGTNRLALPK